MKELFAPQYCTPSSAVSIYFLIVTKSLQSTVAQSGLIKPALNPRPLRLILRHCSPQETLHGSLATKILLLYCWRM